MNRRRVVITPEAEGDLDAIYDQIADAASEQTGLEYIRRVRSHLAKFDLASERGSLRNDLRARLRIVGFERRLAIAFMVIGPEVHILRIFRAGRNWSDAFD